MQNRPNQSPKIKAQAQTRELNQWQAKLGLYMGLLALYALGKTWPT